MPAPMLPRTKGDAPAEHVAAHQAEGDRADAGDQQQHADDVEGRRVVGVARFDQDARAAPERDRAERQVDVERPRPAPGVDDPRADARAERGGQPADGAPQADHDGPLGRRKCRQHDRQRRRHEQRRADALHDARGDQPGDARREAAGQRAEQEDGDADAEDALSAVQVGEPARRHEQGGEDDRVGVEHPREVGRLRAREGAAQGAERRIEDGRVDRDQEDGDAGDEEDEPGRFGPSARYRCRCRRGDGGRDAHARSPEMMSVI